MRVTFGLDFSGGGWPGPLAEQDAVAGEAWLGPGGFLGVLETQLGLVRPHVDPAVRSAALIPALLRIDGFWQRSAEDNPYYTARTLLRWRDYLALHGWKGEGVATRLESLSVLTADVLPGFPDRLGAVAGAIRQRSVDIESVELVDPIAELTPAWRAVLDCLSARGCEVREAEVRAKGPCAEGDLPVAQTGDDRHVAADGSIQLVRPHGPLAAAEEAAAWLAHLPTIEGTVVIGADAVLDSALRRYGLPTLGAVELRDRDAALQILPLTLSLGWKPPDPEFVKEFLNLPLSPIPGRMRFRLLRALQEWPAVGSEVWKSELQEGLEEFDEDRRRRIETRLATLFEPVAERGHMYPCVSIRSRVEEVLSWSRARARADEGAVERSCSLVISQCETLLGMIEASGLEYLRGPQVHRFVEEATLGLAPTPRFGAEAGLWSVERPGAVVGPARNVLWWSFRSGAAPVFSPPPLTPQERDDLRGVGVFLSDPRQVLLGFARRWRRPLEFAEENLFLVCPERHENGEDEHPHPLWDELLASTPGLDQVVVPAAISAREIETYQPPSRRPPRPRLEWDVPVGLISKREVESPSSLDSQVGCPMRWSLMYQARLRAGRSRRLKEGFLLQGSLSHEIIGRVLESGPGSPEAKRDSAAELFRTVGPTLAASLFLPGSDRVRHETERAVSEGAFQLQSLLEQGDLHVQAVEKNLVADSPIGTLGGRPDIVAGSPTTVIDMKWGGAARRRKELRAGAASQLAAYAFLVRAGDAGSRPALAYYILAGGLLLSNDARVPGGEVHSGPSTEAMFTALCAAVESRRAEAADGVLLAPGNPDADGQLYEVEPEILDGELRLPPSCRYCDFSALCGRLFLDSGGVTG